MGVCRGKGITSWGKEVGNGEEDKDFLVCIQCMRLLCRPTKKGGRGYVSPEAHCSLGNPAVMAWEQALTFNCHDLVKRVKEREEGRGGIWGYGEG